MKLSGDFHTHTTYSHGKSTVEENIEQAELLGLKAVAITEHAYNSHYAIKKGDLQRIKQEIDNCKDKYKVKALWGVETNLISRDGDIDVDDEELKDLDLVILGYHRFTKVKGREFFTFILPNLFRRKPTQKQIERNTLAYIKAMDKHRVSILAHLGYGGCAVDYVRLAKECVKRGIYVELNGKRINFGKAELTEMVKTGVKFIINSDAHSKTAVGKNHRAFNMIEKYNIPLEQIVNIDGKIPDFK